MSVLVEGKWRVTAPPTFEPLSLAEAKQQCRVDLSLTDENLLIESYIRAAREFCAGLDWRAYCTQTMELWLDEWPDDDEIIIPRPPLQSVTSVKYYGIDDVEYTFDPAKYFVDTVGEPGQVHLRGYQMWPVTVLRDYNAVCVTYVAGWSTPDLVPETIKQAMRLIVGHFYENREDTQSGTVNRQIENGVRALLGVNQVRSF